MKPTATEWAQISWRGRELRIEYRWLGTSSAAGSPLMVFLHEGLGSVSMWRDYPQRLCEALNWRGLVYSRPGYGRSTPRTAGERWPVEFMHQQAYEVLPALLRVLGVDVSTDRPWLFGHSDGGSIALLHAARFPSAVAGLIVLAPHLFVEELSICSIEKAREAYRNTDLRERLGRHHQDPDSAFWGWNDIWLDPAFRSWNIEAEVAAIRCPVLAVQGEDDEYGTLAQIEHIRLQAPQTRLCVLPRCGHSPHRDQAEAVNAAVRAFVHDACG